MSTAARLRTLAGAPRARVAAAVALGALTICLGAGLMGTAGYLVSRASQRPEILSLTIAIVMVRFFGIARPVVRYLERLASHDLAFRVLGRVRVRVYERLEPLAPVELGAMRGGEVLSRAVADVDALQDLHLRGRGPRAVAVLAGIVTTVAAALVLPQAGLVLAAGLLVAGAGVPAVTAAVARRTGRRQAAARGTLTAGLVETLRAAPELAVYGAADRRLAELAEADRDLVAIARRDATAAGAGDALILLVTGCTLAGVLAVSAAARAAGDLSAVMVAAVALLALAAFEAVQPLPQASRAMTATLAAGRRVLEIVDRDPVVADPVVPADPPPGPAAIALEGVHARYGATGRPVLRGADLVIPPGRRIGLVGPSGAGKTTVVNLLLRFLDPEAGRVTIGGVDLRDMRQEDVRRRIAVAGQDSHLFSASIAANLRVARPGAGDADLEDALGRARILDWVRGLTDGLDTLVGEEGRGLSGGQRSRIVLARALLAGAPLLVLDEPTAHLDPPTAAALVADVVAAAGDRAVLLITHRPEGLDLMDEVVAIRDGRIVHSPERAA